MDMNWNNCASDIYEISPQVIHLSPSHSEKPHVYNNSKLKSNLGKSTMVLLIEFNSSKDSLWDDLNNYIIYDIVDIKGNPNGIYQDLNIIK